MTLWELAVTATRPPRSTASAITSAATEVWEERRAKSQRRALVAVSRYDTHPDVCEGESRGGGGGAGGIGGHPQGK